MKHSIAHLLTPDPFKPGVDRLIITDLWNPNKIWWIERDIQRHYTLIQYTNPSYNDGLMIRTGIARKCTLAHILDTLSWYFRVENGVIK